jgi:hypothetical protein
VGAFMSVLFTLILSVIAMANLCQEWAAPEKVGTLDTKLINESSGIAFSNLYSDRAYHINDSGDGPFFYQTNQHGMNTKKIAIANFEPKDVEDLAIGPCQESQCVFLADIGDNARARTSIQILIFPEMESYPETITSVKKIILRYPDMAHDAEAIAVHPISGDLFLFTKEADYQKERKAYPAKVFRLAKEKLQSSSEHILEEVGSLDLPWINYDFGLFGQIITGMDIHPSGSKLILLTYENAVEIRFDLFLNKPFETRTWQLGSDYSVVRWPLNTSQQEAISYSNDGNSFYFTSEFNPDFGDKDAPIFQTKCTKP